MSISLSDAQRPEFFEFLTARVGRPVEADGGRRKVIACLRDGDIEAVVAYGAFTGRCCEVTVATSTTLRAISRRFLRLAFWYPFGQLGLPRVQALVRPSNLGSMNQVRRLGFVEEGRLRQWCHDGEDAVVFGMLRHECRWIVR